MANYRTTLRRVLCLSGTAAALAAIELCLDVGSGWQLFADSTYKNHYALDISLLVLCGIIALIVPCCGYHGAQNGDVGEVACFAYSNYCMSCCDAFVVAAFLCVGVAFWWFRTIARACNMVPPSNKCDEETKASLFQVCSSWDSAFREYHNDTQDVRIELNSTHVSQLLSEQHCLDTLNEISSVFLALFILVAMLRCCGCCFHCASGWYGHELKRMLRDGRAEKHLDLEGSQYSDSDSE